MVNKKEFIRFMVESGVLSFGEFKTKSGRLSPYFINTGNYRTGRQAAKLSDFYADCIHEGIEKGIIPKNLNALFGPAYKGIPLAAGAASSLFTKYGLDVGYCYNRKEAKDHGEGGTLVGYKPNKGDTLIIIEDVVTAGTAVRETLPQLKAAAEDINVPALIISVDRMEKGTGDISATKELYTTYGIKTLPIVTIMDIKKALISGELSDLISVDDSLLLRIDAYMESYCVIEG